jgi:hypothetical protein
LRAGECRYVPKKHVQHELLSRACSFPSLIPSPMELTRVTRLLQRLSCTLMPRPRPRPPSFITRHFLRTTKQLLHTRVLTVRSLPASIVSYTTYGSSVSRKDTMDPRSSDRPQRPRKVRLASHCYTRSPWIQILCLLCTPTTIIFNN